MISWNQRHRFALWLLFLCLITGCKPTLLPATSPPPEETMSISTSITESIATAENILTTENISTTKPPPTTEIIPTTEITWETSFETIPETVQETYSEVTTETSWIPPFEVTLETTCEPTSESPSETTCESTSEPPPAPITPSSQELAEIAFDLQNQYLIQHQVTPLQWSDTLYQVATSRVQDLFTDYSHEGCPSWVGENILRGSISPEITIQVWQDSEGHRRNMLAGWTYGAIAHEGTLWVAIYSMTETP